MAEFFTAYKRTMVVEGGYANDPTDAGGETWKGVSRRANPTWRGWDIIDRKKKEAGFPGSLKGDQELEAAVQDIYKKKYWDVYRLDDCPSQLIASEVFDTGVNMGVGASTKMLQRGLNVLNKGGTLYPDTKVDGDYGPGAHSAMQGFFRTVPSDRWIALYKILNCLQGARYIEIAESNSSQEKYMYGWLGRVFEEG
jgi:lysozyme family protein